jgi:hypothetical protein
MNLLLPIPGTDEMMTSDIRNLLTFPVGVKTVSDV